MLPAKPRLNLPTPVSLAEYAGRMRDGQREIYHLTAPSREAAEASPYFEAFKARGWEVLFSYDGVDEFVFQHLHEFEGKPLKNAEKAELKLDPPAEGALSDDEARLVANFVKETLGGRVGEVRTSRRLVDSPAVVLEAGDHTTATMRRMLKAMKRDAELGDAKFDFELNPGHPVVVGLAGLRKDDPALAAQVAEQLFDGARLAAGLLDDPRALLARMNALLARVVGKPPAA